MISRTLTVRCVSGHEKYIEDDDRKIGRQGYVRCTEKNCKRNAFIVNVTTQEDGATEDDMNHLDAPGTCPHCGRYLTGQNL